VTIHGLKNYPIEYRARNILDAKQFVDRALNGRSDVDWQGDTIINFAYHRTGD